jgi:hypothetical protein
MVYYRTQVKVKDNIDNVVRTYKSSNTFETKSKAKKNLMKTKKAFGKDYVSGKIITAKKFS